MLIDKSNLKPFTYYLLSTIMLWFLRMILPGMKYLFVPAIILLLIPFILLIFKSVIRRAFLFELLKTINPLIVLGLFYLIGVLLSNQFYNKVYKDLIEYATNLIFLSGVFYLVHRAKADQGFISVFRQLTNLIGITSLAVAILGIGKFLLQINDIYLPITTPYGTAFNSDKNFYALFSFLGIISYFPYFSSQISRKKSLLIQFIIVVHLVNVVLSFSLRSLFLLTIITLVLVFFQVYALFKPHGDFIPALSKNLRYVTVILITSYAISTIYFGKNQQELASLKPHYWNEKAVTNESEANAIFDAFNTQKWVYAIHIFKDYSWSQKLFGSGFDYLPRYGQHFNGNSRQYDYPHNPVLSALLYSGVLGAIFTLLFLIISVYYSIIYFRRYPIFAMMLITCLAFVFFSGNSLFSIPVFLFLFSLSFVIRHQEVTELQIDANLAKLGSKFLKESFDYITATLAFIILIPLLAIISLLIILTMGWPVIYSQTRVGQNGKTFRLHKFRSMNKAKSTTTIAAAEVNRISWLGKILRKTKMDELPELWNIIRGDMSFVGTRPDVPGYADKLEGEDRIILKLKPGITGPASLKYIDEEEILAKQANPQEYNDNVIWPDKVAINKDYYKNWSFFTDIKLIYRTLIRSK